MSVRLDDAVESVPGVGPRRARALAERGIDTVDDFLHHLPIRYEDRASQRTIRSVREGETVTLEAVVVQSALQPTRRRGFSIVAVLVQDGSGSLRVVFFNRPYLKDRLVRGTRASFHGRVGRGPQGGLQLQNPDFEILGAEADAADADGLVSGLVPVHSKLPGFSPRGLRVALKRLLDELPTDLPRTLPAGTEERLGLLDRATALRRAHFPPPGSAAEEYDRRASEAHRRLIFEELFAMQLAFLARRRLLGPRPPGRTYRTSRDVGDRLRALLPFRLTAGQRRAFREVVEDLTSAVPMSRLLQGDVGSGKTIVALLAMLLAAESGHQAALMAPTEILAEQHAASFRALLGDARRIGLLTGSLTGAARRELLEDVAAGELSLVVGTHALIQRTVEFRDLALVVVDEQHRFGIAQRLELAAKADRPDVLVMSATPIPRTLSLSLHGDLDVSTIPDRPPGRRPVRTVVREPSARARIVRFLGDETGRGRQAYVVHPTIDETEEQDLRAAIAGHEQLVEALPDRRVELLHGRLRADERDAVMREFVAGRIDVLVATTVIEVGVDVPNATVMLIENAERFGIAQLHQLRGRVGRGSHRSWCILVAGSRRPEARRRLELVASTDDGFALAEADLAARGAGELFGTRQAGLRDLRVADPVRDRDLLEAARTEARRHLESLRDADVRDDELTRAALRRWSVAAEGTVAG